MLNIVVTCTYRKRKTGLASRIPVDQTVRLREAQGSMSDRVGAWWRMLESSDAPVLAARDLYAGEHWITALQLPEIAIAQGLEATLWVCSAGYGLIPLDERLKPYSATFSPGPDSVHRPGVDEASPPDANEAWWDLLARTNSRSGRPVTISELHSDRANSQLMVVASARYLRALRGDLRNTCLDDPDRVLLVSAGYPDNDDLQPLLLPASARLQPEVGGVRQALNARLAREVLEKMQPGAGFTRIRRCFEERLERAPELTTYDRTPIADDEVRDFIKAHILTLREAGQRARHTPLLRILRDQGRACEQSRFRRLFAEVERQLDA